ncbi:uncharacterized protein V6R79_017191 [Siganus canaliculatus]
MDADLNVTYITLGGHVGLPRFRYLYFLIVFTVFVLILCSNSTIVYLICVHPNLHEPMYVFIAALLVNSVLFSSAIYPKLLLDFLSDRQIISYSACLLQGFLFYSLGGSEFLLLAAMAYDRYVSICRPLQYAAVMRSSRVRSFLLVAWLLPAAQLIVQSSVNSREKLCSFTLEVIFCNNSVHKLHCVTSRVLSVFGLFILMNVAILPLLFIVFTYLRIFAVTYRSCREVRRKAAETCLPHLIVLLSFSMLCTYDVIMVRLEAEIPKTVALVMTLQLVLYHPLLNPLIYGLKMKEISKHLKRLLCPHRKTRGPQCR